MRACVLLVLLLSAGASAQDDPLRAAGTDPVELRRAAQRLGDAVVIERIGRADLAAVRAAPHLVGPELALGALARLAAGRDPDLAPSAMTSALAIAEALDANAIERREVLRSDLDPARQAFERLAADASARADLREAARFVVRLIERVFAPAAQPVHAATP